MESPGTLVQIREEVYSGFLLCSTSRCKPAAPGNSALDQGQDFRSPLVGNPTACSFKTGTLTEGISWLDGGLPSHLWEVTSLRIPALNQCSRYFDSVTEAFLSTFENRPLSAPSFFSLHYSVCFLWISGFGN